MLHPEIAPSLGDAVQHPGEGDGRGVEPHLRNEAPARHGLAACLAGGCQFPPAPAEHVQDVIQPMEQDDHQLGQEEEHEQCRHAEHEGVVPVGALLLEGERGPDQQPEHAYTDDPVGDADHAPGGGAEARQGRVHALVGVQVDQDQHGHDDEEYGEAA